MSNPNVAVHLRNQVEIDRKVALEDVNRRFDSLLEAISTVYNVGNLKPANIVTKTRKPKAVKPAANATTAKPGDTIVPAGDDTTTPFDAPAAAPEEEDASYELSESLHENCTTIRLFLLENSENGAGKSAILEGTGLVESVYAACMKKMLDDGTITFKGERKGRKYFAKTAFDKEGDDPSTTEDGE